MRQFQVEYINSNHFIRELDRIQRYCHRSTHSQVIFHIEIAADLSDRVHVITDTIEKKFPQAVYYGNQSLANICGGRLSREWALIVCTILEEDTSDVQVINIRKDSAISSLEDLWAYCRAVPDLKGVELLASFASVARLGIGESQVDLPEDVQVFGGVALHHRNVNSHAFVFSKGFPPSQEDCVAVVFSGREMHVKCAYILGWKALGKKFRVTDCDNHIIRTLDGKPAFEMYKTYLGINASDELTISAFWFPMLIKKSGLECIRNPMDLYPDGSIRIGVKTKKGEVVRLAYGDPHAIISEVKQVMHEIAEFSPSMIRLFSCGGRFFYWGEERVSMETDHFDAIAPASGFYTRGEILKVNSFLHLLNSTLLVVAIREGEPIDYEYEDIEDFGQEVDAHLMNGRLICFVETVTKELEAAYDKIVAALNTDILTGVGNRRAYETYISELEKKPLPENLIVISSDVNSLKAVNDRLGHAAGDELIIGTAAVLEETFSAYGRIFRTGGDEFQTLIVSDEPMEVLLRRLKENYARWRGKLVDSLRVSTGYVLAKEMPNQGLMEMFKVADKRMYDDKRAYYGASNKDRRKG
ncbi:MAG: sensor domain-containing diguanylate cyclase [Schwartzia sp. (in: firmicutes)]